MFSKLLNQLAARTKGAEMVLLVGTDGIVIERAGKEKDGEFESLAAEYAVVLNRSRSTATEIGRASCRERVYSSV